MSVLPNQALTSLNIVQSEQGLIRRLLNIVLREQLVEFTLEENRVVIPIANDHMLIGYDAKKYSLNRIEVSGPIIIVKSYQAVLISQFETFLKSIREALIDSCEAYQWQRFQAELENCVENDALTMPHVQSENNHLANQMNEAGYDSLLGYLQAKLTQEEQIIFFEQWATSGHPYHPCYRTKLGFSQQDVLDFSPEYGKTIYIPMGAVERSLLHVESLDDSLDYQQWFSHQFKDQWQAWQQKLMDLNVNPNDYQPIFIHPWQAKNRLHEFFQMLLHKQKIMVFWDITIATKASLSFRTMFPVESGLPYIKLPVGIQTTSALRTVSPASVQNGPKLSRILQSILMKENYFNQSLKLSAEVFGYHIKNDDSDVAKFLSGIFRENVLSLISKNQTPIMVAALMETSPRSQLPLFIEICQSAAGQSLAAALSYFTQYADMVVHAFLDLYLIYGIALEGHQQNTVIVFEDNLPKFVISRDLGGIKIHLPSLNANGYEFTAHPDASIISHDDYEVTNNFLHTVMQCHLGELILLLAKHYQVAENIFWQPVKNSLITRFAALQPRVPNTRFTQEYKAILKSDWQVKGLMRMRLKNLSHQYIYLNLPNPLQGY